MSTQVYTTTFSINSSNNIVSYNTPKCQHIERSPVNDGRPISLVTGGAGFIGLHLCRELLKLGHTVYCLDIKNLFTVKIQFINEEHFHYLECDVLKMFDEKYIQMRSCGHCQTMVNIFQAHNIDHIDYIYHLACHASPRFYQQDKINTMNVCVSGTTNVIKLAQTMKARLLITSTSEVYGEPTNHPQSETDPLCVRIGPRACYDIGKIAAEVLLNDAVIEGGKRIARIFNTYGPGLDDGRVMGNFIKQALAGHQLTIYGDGSQTRSFCYVEDTVWGLIRLMNSDYEMTVNIGNPVEITIRQLAQLITEKIAPKVGIINLDLPTDDPTRRCPNIQLAEEKLHWSPKISLNEGIDKTIEWFQKQKNETVNVNRYLGNHGC